MLSRVASLLERTIHRFKKEELELRESFSKHYGELIARKRRAVCEIEDFRCLALKTLEQVKGSDLLSSRADTITR